MSSTLLKPNATSSTKLDDPVGAILNRARSTLSQSRQFRADPSPSSSFTKFKPPLPRVSSSSKIKQPLPPETSTSGNLKVEGTTIQQFDKNVSTNSIDDLLVHTKTILEQKNKNRHQKGDVTPSSVNTTSGQNASSALLPSNAAPPIITKSAANYDYDSIFANANNSKRIERSDFNMYKVGNSLNAQASVGTDREGSDMIKADTDGFAEKLKKPSKARFRSSDPNKSQALKEGWENEQDDETDEDTESEGTSYDSHDDSTDDDDDDYGQGDNDDESTITPPTITETQSKSLSNPKKDVTIRPMSLKAITLGDENDIRGDFYRQSPRSRKIKVQDLRDRPLVFLSNESHAVFKAMSPDPNDDYDSYSKQYDNLTPKSYASDFVSEIQSVADDFSRSYARSVSLIESLDLDVPGTDSGSIEVPHEEDSNQSHSHRKLSHKNAVNSVRIVNEIKGNLQDLEISDSQASRSLSEEDVALSKSKQDGPHSVPVSTENSQVVITSMSSTAQQSNPKIMTTSKSTESKSRKSRAESASTSISIIKPKQRSTLLDRGTSSAKGEKTPASKGTSHNLPPKNKPPSQIDVILSRQSSRKNFQAALSQVKLHDDDEVDTANDSAAIIVKQTKKEKAKMLEQAYSYNIPKTKPQTQIHSILEKEVYRKELSRIRNTRHREAKEMQRINEERNKNFKTVQERRKEKSKFRQPTLHFPAELETDLSSSGNWGAPYFNLDGSLSQGYQLQNMPRSPNAENYALKVGNMDVPQLVREVIKSNERMYKMTVRAANEMSKEYGKNVKLARKMKDGQPIKPRI